MNDAADRTSRRAHVGQHVWLAVAAAASTSSRVTTAIVVGATGNLAAKYLWVALFRLALRASLEQGNAFSFIAGASESPERGARWLRAFFDDAFERRVCGSDVHADDQARACVSFFRDKFAPSIRYVPLRSEAHYRDAAHMLQARTAVEAGRLVYLAIPPDHFLQACELVDRFLRIRRDEAVGGDTPFLRVVIEKPFGTSAESARVLAAGLKRVLRDDEVYLMDHYAGKPAVCAWRSYLERNRALLRPLWSSSYISHVQVEMTETETLEGRIRYFHRSGIVRDVMANHLHLLLGFTVAPSWPKELADQDRAQRLAFTESLRWRDGTLHTWQYADYRAHYDRWGDGEEPSSAFEAVRTPTAAHVSLTSELAEWNATLFTLAAAKAAANRLLTIRLVFAPAGRAAEASQAPCTLTAVIQREVNAPAGQSFRWSCDLVPYETHEPPSGWQFTDTSKRMMVPQPAGRSRGAAWQLGDEASAYDSLLWAAASGDSSPFADVTEVLAAWRLWTPIAEAAEEAWLSPSVAGSDREERVYPTGTTPWRARRVARDARTSADAYPRAVDEL